MITKVNEIYLVDLSTKRNYMLVITTIKVISEGGTQK